MSGRPSELDDRFVSRFLALGRTARRRAVDLLLDELYEAEPVRFAELLAAAPGPAKRLLEAHDPRSRVSVTDLRALKDACKAEVEQQVGESRLACLAGYFTALACARAQHGVSISSRSSAEVRGVLGELADAILPPWSELFRRASTVPSEPA